MFSVILWSSLTCKNKKDTLVDASAQSHLIERFSKRMGTSSQNRKVCGESGHDSISTSCVSIAIPPNKFRTSLHCFSPHNQNAWDLCKLCSYEQDNAVWNDFKPHFQDNQVPFIVLFGVFVKIYCLIYSGFSKENTVVKKLSKISGLSSLLI